MPTYLWQASYTPDGARGLAKEGGSKRRAAVEQMVSKAGGIGKADVYGIVEFPDPATAVAVSLFDAASKKTISYRPPGAS